jgi:hypothetical protein
MKLPLGSLRAAVPIAIAEGTRIHHEFTIRCVQLFVEPEHSGAVSV